jgi:protein tyrosine/serine phosphatase
MRFRKVSPSVITALAVVLSLSSVVFAKSKNPDFPNIKIKNFGQLDERFHRGARPKEQDFKALAGLGIKTVIDLTDNSREYEQPAVEAAGLRYINIPMKDKSYPSMDQINEFLKVANDPATGKFFVHCAGGRHRTGVVGAVYRFTQHNWDLEKVLGEMDQFDFGAGFGHGKQKDFVKDYWEQFQAKQTQAETVTISNR